MKKGFTLIEIIISISIILIIGASTTFFVISNKNNNELDIITKKILEAANVYANKEIDENGKIIINEVRSGKKGIKIPLSNLVNKGYIEKEEEEKIAEITDLGNLYIMLLNGYNEDHPYCNGEIFSLASWVDEDYSKEYYLCNTVVPEEEKTGKEYLIELFEERKIEQTDGFCFKTGQLYSFNYKFHYDHYETDTSPGICSTLDGDCVIGEDSFYIKEIDQYISVIRPQYNGLVESTTSPEMGYYHYSGQVNNNYLKIGNSKERLRIVSALWTATDDWENKAAGIKEMYIKVAASGIIAINPTTELDNWYNNFIENEKIFVSQNIYYQGQKKLDYAISPDNGIASCGVYATLTNEIPNEKNIGILNKFDALLAGITPKDYTEYPSYNNFVWLNENFNIKLNDGCILNETDTGNYATYNTHFGILSDSCAAKYIKPTLIIDVNKIKVSGTGYKNDPFIINPI